MVNVYQSVKVVVMKILVFNAHSLAEDKKIQIDVFARMVILMKDYKIVEFVIILVKLV